MKKVIFITMILINASVFAAGSRQYQPISEWENQFYQAIDKSVFPDDVRENIQQHEDTLVGWVGIIEKYMTDETNEEYNVIAYYLRHHYYDWIEDFDAENRPIKLSSDGEGYFVCYYYVKKDADLNALTKDPIGDCLINYGYPVEIEDEVITVSTEYLRIIPKDYVNPGWMNYGREGFDI